MRSTEPSVPFSSIPMCEAYRINKFPLSGLCWENARNPVVPAKGIPPRPASEKL